MRKTERPIKETGWPVQETERPVKEIGWPVQETEWLVKETLLDRAARQPNAGELLPRVRIGYRRRQVRLRIVTVGASAVLAVLLVATWAVVNRPAGHRSHPAVPGSLPSSRLLPGDPYTTTFPFTPTGAPAGVGEPSAGIASGNPMLVYGSGGAGSPVLTVSVTPTRPAYPDQLWTSPTPVPVRGASGTVASSRPDGDLLSLTFLDRPGQWVEIRASASIGVDRLVGYANGLAAKPMAPVRPFDFDLLPAGTYVSELNSSTVAFRPLGVAPGGDFIRDIVVMLDGSQPDGQGQRISAGGRPGTLSRVDGGVRMLRVGLSAGRTLVVQVGPEITLTDNDLIRFAAGIRPTAAATVSNG